MRGALGNRVRATRWAMVLALLAHGALARPRLLQEAPKRPAALSRVLVTALGALLVGGVPALVSVPFFVSGASDASKVLSVGVVLQPLFATLGGWGTHRLMEGEGSVISALVGTFLGLSVAGGAVAAIWGVLGLTTQPFDAFNFAVPLAVGALFSMSVVAIALERSHDGVLALTAFGVAPVPHGALLAATFRF